jgi:hypothetical protein
MQLQLSCSGESVTRCTLLAAEVQNFFVGVSDGNGKSQRRRLLFSGREWGQPGIVWVGPSTLCSLPAGPTRAGCTGRPRLAVFLSLDGGATSNVFFFSSLHLFRTINQPVLTLLTYHRSYCVLEKQGPSRHCFLRG